VVQPLAIINAPPVHFDILGSDTVDISDRYPLAAQSPNYETMVSYYNRRASPLPPRPRCAVTGPFQQSGIVDEHRGYDFRSYMEKNYGDHFSKKSGTVETITVGSNITAMTDDRLYYVRLSYDLLEYSVTSRGDTVGHVLVMTRPKPHTVGVRPKASRRLSPITRSRTFSPIPRR